MPRLRILALGLLLLVVAWGVQTLWLGGRFETLDPHFSGSCTPVVGISGPEDLTIHPERGIAYVSGYDRAAAEAGGEGRGGVYAYGLDGDSGSLANLTPDAPPDARPHGISLWRGEDGRERLFVVDHEGGRHAIRIYDLQGDRLVPAGTLRDPLLVSPNDLVAVGADRFYVTNDHRWPDGWRNTLENYLRLPVSNVVYFDGEGFREAADGLRFPNGINASADGREVYVASTLGREILVYDRDPASGELRWRESVALGTSPDNIEVDASGALWVGAHPKLLQLVSYMAGRAERSPSQVLRVARGEGGWKLEEVYLGEGDELSASSVAAVHGDRLLIGAIVGERFLDCRLRGRRQEADPRRVSRRRKGPAKRDRS